MLDVCPHEDGIRLAQRVGHQGLGHVALLLLCEALVDDPGEQQLGEGEKVQWSVATHSEDHVKHYFMLALPTKKHLILNNIVSACAMPSSLLHCPARKKAPATIIHC